MSIREKDAPRELFRKLLHPMFIGKRLGRIPYPAQMVYMLCPHQDKVAICGRGVGKSTVLEADDMTRAAIAMPHAKGYVNNVSSPIRFVGLFLAPTKEQSWELVNEVRQGFMADPFFETRLSPLTTKTNIVLTNGARLLIRPATAAARGQHAKTLTVDGKVFRGIIRIKVDEAAFLPRDDYVTEVLEPMLLIAGSGKSLELLTTPYGKTGDVWTRYSSASTGRCQQWYSFDEEGFKVYEFEDDLRRPVLFGNQQPVPEVLRGSGGRVKFDLGKCRGCMLQYKCVVHNFPSVENPYADVDYLLSTKRELYDTGREHVWRQEFLGIPESTRGLFFNETHQRRMFNDSLPQIRLDEDGELRKIRLSERIMDSRDEGFYDEPLSYTDVRGRFYLSIDGNAGVESSRADYAVVSLVEEEPSGYCPLRLMERFRSGKSLMPRKKGGVPERFLDSRYSPKDVTVFIIDFVSYLVRTFDVKRVYIDQGFGQQYYVPLTQMFGEKLIEYIPNSAQQKMRSLLHLRQMIDRGLCQSPEIEFLRREIQYLEVEEDSLEEDRLKVKKSRGWGVLDAQVDGVFSWAYAMRGTEKVLKQASISFDNWLPMMGEENEVSDGENLLSRRVNLGELVVGG
ncbi:hypothetical protein KJZ99_00035 [bacterium]|nr:hypothetical protein [bacterium]